MMDAKAVVVGLLLAGAVGIAAQDRDAKSTPQAGVDQLAWLAGHWVAESGNRTTEEIWTDGTGGVMFGISRTILGGKVKEFEFLRIAVDAEGLAYLASPGGRCPPTRFGLVEAADQRVVFANPQHDFPQRIEYRREGDTLTAKISGTVNGQEKSMSWQWKRRSPGP